MDLTLGRSPTSTYAILQAMLFDASGYHTTSANQFIPTYFLFEFYVIIFKVPSVARSPKREIVFTKYITIFIFIGISYWGRYRGYHT